MSVRLFVRQHTSVIVVVEFPDTDDLHVRTSLSPSTIEYRIHRLLHVEPRAIVNTTINSGVVAAVLFYYYYLSNSI